MHCPRCQHENRPQAKFCEECGTPLTSQSEWRASTVICGDHERPDRGAGAADGDRRDPARHRELADRRPARVRGGVDERRPSVRRLRCHDLPGRWRRAPPRRSRGPDPLHSCGRVSADGERPRDVRYSTGGRSTSPICRPRLTNTLRAVSLRGPTVSGQCSMFLCSAGPRPSGRSPSGGPRFGRSPTGKSSSCKTFADQAVIAIENVRLFRS